MKTFKAFLINQDAQRKVQSGFTTLSENDLDKGDVLIKVAYSSVNYKDALAATGKGAIIRRFPCVGGIDLAGTVVTSAAPRFKPGDRVLATSYDIGVAHHGGYAEYALLPGPWVFPLPQNLDMPSAMALGTAGLTAALAIMRMEANGLKPENGRVVVTGASGGVGSLAVDMLAGRGYEVCALTGKAEQGSWLKNLGAQDVMLRQDLDVQHIRPLDKGIWAGAVDNLGGPVLAWLLSTMRPAGTVASVGLAQDSELNTTVMPFILRGVSLLGIDSGYAGFALRENAWTRLASDLKPRFLADIMRVIPFADLPKVFAELIAGNAHGRVVVKINSEK